MTTLRIATRKSPLALWQSEHVAARLRDAHPGLAVELVPMSTRGDEVLDRSLAAIGGKGLFLKELELAMLRGEDLIEESLKSLEDEFGERFVRIHRNCLVARHELVELKRGIDGHVQAILRSGGAPLEVSRRCVPYLRQTLLHP